MLDVLVVGAGLSGIGAACHLERDAPEATYEIVEARSVSGGTWELFRYPGVRSDSDIFTYAYSFRAWTGQDTIANGADILDYLRDTAAQYGVDRYITYGQRVVAAKFSLAEACWTVQLRDAQTDAVSTRTCRFLYVCSGYYDYDEGYTPPWPGRDSYQGVLLHPQRWPEDLDVANRRVVVVGSGATAVTLVPALAVEGAHVTMIQRSPSYVMSLPTSDPVAAVLRCVLPAGVALRAVRWKNARIATAIYTLCQRYPARARAVLRTATVKQLPAGFDVDTHFNPSYKPWDQRLCLVPDGDLFDAVRAGRAEVVTATIEQFNASWTLKVDLVSGYVARLVAHMRRHGLGMVTPQLPAPPMATSSFIEMRSGYFERARHLLPRQGDRAPWRLHQHPFRDRALFADQLGDAADLRFQRAPVSAAHSA